MPTQERRTRPQITDPCSSRTSSQPCWAVGEEKEDAHTFLLADEALLGGMEGRKETTASCLMWSGAGVQGRRCALRFGNRGHCPHSSGQEWDGTRLATYCGAASRFPLFVAIFLSNEWFPYYLLIVDLFYFLSHFFHCFPWCLHSKHTNYIENFVKTKEKSDTERQIHGNTDLHTIF